MNIKMDLTIRVPTAPNFVSAEGSDFKVQLDVADLTDDQVETLITTMAQKFRENVKLRRELRARPEAKKIIQTTEGFPW